MTAAAAMATRRYCGECATDRSQGEAARSRGCESNVTVTYRTSATSSASSPSEATRKWAAEATAVPGLTPGARRVAWKRK